MDKLLFFLALHSFGCCWRRNMMCNRKWLFAHMARANVKFFDIYGCKFNTFDIGLSCDGAGTFFLKSNKGFLVEESPFLIAIEEPQPQELFGGS
ncbi:hypothetical protein CsSME_00018566 [Camellia sinensis var. sinensis]